MKSKWRDSVPCWTLYNAIVAFFVATLLYVAYINQDPYNIASAWICVGIWTDTREYREGRQTLLSQLKVLWPIVIYQQWKR